MDLKWNWFRLVRNQPKRQCWLDADAGSRGQGAAGFGGAPEIAKAAGRLDSVSTAATNASERFIAGPANATSASSCSGSR